MWSVVIPSSYRYTDFDIMNTILPLSRSGSFIVERRLKGRHDLRLRVAGHHHPRPQLNDRQYRSRSLAIQAFGTSHLRVPELRGVKRRHPASFHHTDKPVLSSDSCFIALPSQDQDRRVAGYGIGSGAPRQQNLSIPFHQVLVDRRHFRIFYPTVPPPWAQGNRCRLPAPTLSWP